MENASKALIIAGAILLSILIISLGILIFSQAQDTINSINMSEQEIMAFNNKFTPYEGKVRGSQVNALAQAVLTNNRSATENGEEETKGITMSGEGINIDKKGESTSVKKLSAGTIYQTTFEYKNGLVNTIKVTNLTSGSGTPDKQ